MPMQQAVPSIQCSALILTLVIVGLASTLSACGVAYTIVKSESKLDRLAVPMTKAEVIEQIAEAKEHRHGITRHWKRPGHRPRHARASLRAPAFRSDGRDSR